MTVWPGRCARPIRCNDGDTIFGLATGDEDLIAPAADAAFRSPSSRAVVLDALLAAAAGCFAAACTIAVVEARSVGSFLSYRDLVPSAFARGSRPAPRSLSAGRTPAR